MADFRPLLWDPSGPVKRRFADTDTLFLNTDGTNNVLDLQISSSSAFVLGNDGVLTHTPPSPTAALDAQTLTLTSGGVTSATVKGLVVDITGDSGDSSAEYRGINLDYTTGGGTDNAYGIQIGSGWDYGIYSDAKGYFNHLSDSSEVSLTARVESTGISAGTILISEKDIVVTDSGDTGGTLIAFDIQLVDNGGSASTFGLRIASTTFDYGIYSVAPSYFDMTASSSKDVVRADIDTSGVSSGTYRAFYASAANNAGDTGGTIIAYDARYVENGGTTSSYAFRVNDTDFDYGLYNLSPTYLYANTTGHALEVVQANASGNVAQFSGTLGARFLMNNYGVTTITVSDGTDGVTINQTANGDVLRLEDSGSSRWEFDDGGNVVHSPGDPTAAFDAHNLTITSGGITSATVQGIDVDISGLLNSDTSAEFRGINLNFTAGGGTSTETAYGLYASSGWDFGAHLESPLSYNIGGTTGFVQYDGDRAAGTSGNINTDNAAGEMLRVDVDDGAGGFNTRWVPAYSGTTMPSTTGNDLDEAYDAFGGAGTVNIDAGNLTWLITSPYDFVVSDSGGNYIDIETNTGTLDFKTSKTNGSISITAEGSAANLSLLASGTSGGVTVESTNSTVAVTSGAGTTIGAGGTSSWTVSSGNLNFTSNSGTRNDDMLTWDVVSKRAISIVSANDAGNYGFTIENKGSLTSYVRTTAAGDLQIYADTSSSSADLTLSAGGACSLNSTDGNNTIEVYSDGYDAKIIVPNHANSDILFTAHGQADIPINSAADPSLDTTAQNIVGAINEVNAAVATPTWDQIYAGDQALTIDGSTLTFSQTSTSNPGFTIERALAAASTNAPIVFMQNSPSGAYDDQAALRVEYSDKVGGTIDVVSLESHIESTIGIGASSFAKAFEAKFTGHASDNAAAGIFGFYAEGSATSTSTSKYGFYCDQNWDYGYYSLAKSLIATPAGFTNTGQALDVTGTSGILNDGQVMTVIEATADNDASDSATSFTYGVSAVGDGAGSSTKYGFYTDANWDYSVYGLATIRSEQTGLTDSEEGIRANLESSGVGAKGLIGFRSTINNDAGDTGTTYGYYAQVGGTSSNQSEVYGFYADDSWGADGYGVYSESRSLIEDTFSDTGVVFTVNSTSGGLAAAEILSGIKSAITGNAGDNATSGIYGFHAGGSTTGSAVKYAYYADADWDLALHASARAYVTSAPANGGGSLEHWTIEAKPDTDAAGLASNDEVAAFKATIEDDSDDLGAFYYGLYITTTDTGPAAKWGIHIDDTWPADHYAMRIRSGLWYVEEDFGTVTSDTDHIDVNLSGLLNSTNEGRAINLDITPDSSQADGSSWIGVRANMVNTNANDTVGSFAFHANDNWHYAFYGDNDLSKQQPPDNEGTIHIESTSSSAVASGTYSGYSHYHTRHASDSGGSHRAYYAQANAAAGSLALYGFYADDNLNVGFYSEAEGSTFARQSADWTSSTAAVVGISNNNSSNIEPALKLATANTGATGTCLEIDHSYDGSDTEDTRRAIVFTSAQTNVRRIPLSMWQPKHTTSALDWQYDGYASGATNYQRYLSNSTTEKYINIPLMLPHDSVIKEVKVYVYHTNTSTVAPYLRLCRHGNGGTSTLISSTTGTTSTGAQTITITGLSHTVDNVVEDYYMMYKNGAHSSSSIDYIYYAEVTYEITDFAAGCGW